MVDTWEGHGPIKTHRDRGPCSQDTRPVSRLSFSPGQSSFLDLIRLVSAQVVLGIHLMEWLVAPWLRAEDFAWATALGGAAVSLFFVLSGLLVTQSVLRAGSSGGFDLRAYAANRVARLYPTLLFALGVTVACYGLIRQLGLLGSESYTMPGLEAGFPRLVAQAKASNVVATGLFLNGMIGVEGFNLGTVGMNGPLWSLSHEFWFYVCAGLAAHGYYNRSLAGCLGLALVLAWQALTSNVGWLVGLAIWCGGAALAFMGRTAPRGVTWAMLGVGTAAMITLMAQAQGPMQHAHRMWLGSASILIVAAGLALTREARPLPSFAKSGADYSFTLYAIHWPLVQNPDGSREVRCGTACEISRALPDSSSVRAAPSVMASGHEYTSVDGWNR